MHLSELAHQWQSARIPNQIPSQDSTQSSGGKAAVEPGVMMWLVVTMDG